MLQTLTATYLRLKGHSEIENGGFVLDILGIPDPGELEDAYMKYANAKVCPPRPGEKTYRVRGTKEPFYTSLVKSNNPVVSLSRRPTGNSSFCSGTVRRLTTVGAVLSLVADTTPSGLFNR